MSRRAFEKRHAGPAKGDVQDHMDERRQGGEKKGGGIKREKSFLRKWSLKQEKIQKGGGQKRDANGPSDKGCNTLNWDMGGGKHPLNL